MAELVPGDSNSDLVNIAPKVEDKTNESKIPGKVSDIEEDNMTDADKRQHHMIDTDTQGHHVMDKLESMLSGPFYQCCHGKDINGRKKSVLQRVPWHFFVQILTTIFIIIQVDSFGSERMAYVSYLEKSRVALKHLLLLRWDTSYETMPYPPSSGPYAIYDVDDLVSHIDNAILKFSMLPNMSAGSMFFDHIDNTNLSIEICVGYTDTIRLPTDEHLEIRNGKFTNCTGSSMSDNEIVENYRSRVFELTNSTFDKSILEIEMRFGLRSVWVLYSDNEDIKKVLCFKMSVRIQFDNRDRNGQMTVLLTTAPRQLSCRGPFTHRIDISDLCVSGILLLLVVTSLIITVRICWKSCLLLKEVNIIYKDVLTRDGVTDEDEITGISCGGALEIVKTWDFAVILGDVFTFVGTILKIVIEYSYISQLLNDICGFFLGAGLLLLIFGLFRFISFSKRAYVLFLTIYRALKDICWTFLCMFMIFVGFALCGWIMFGPYNIKFTTPFTSMNCLFALWNGDEVYVTLMSGNTDRPVIYVMLRIYIYLYVGLMTIIALNIFIAIFTNVLEDVKEMIQNSKPLSDLDEFRNRYHRQNMNTPKIRICGLFCSKCY